MSEPVCGAVIGEPCAFEVECQLPAGHEGEHFAEVRWPNTPPSPRPELPSPMSEMLQAVWTKTLNDALTRRMQ